MASISTITGHGFEKERLSETEQTKTCDQDRKARKVVRKRKIERAE